MPRAPRLAAPRAVVAAFDEAIDLYRAVKGSETTVASFVEALVGEASAGGLSSRNRARSRGRGAGFRRHRDGSRALHRPLAEPSPIDGRLLGPRPRPRHPGT